MTSTRTYTVTHVVASSVTVGPLAIQFTNRNTAMGLRAHSHLAEVTVTFRDLDPGKAPGWPSFETTNRALAEVLREAVAHPVTGTNEDVTGVLWDAVATWLAQGGVSADAGSYPECRYGLDRLVLAVRGVPDAIGHDDGWTRYTIQTIDPAATTERRS